MSRGRKPKNSESNMQPSELVRTKIGWYFQLICTEMSKAKITSSENAVELLTRIKTTRSEKTNGKKSKGLKILDPPMAGEIPFDIPSNWSWCRVGEVIDHNSGKTLDGGRNTGASRDCITTSNLQWGRFELEAIKQIPIEDSELSRCTATNGDLLVCEGGEAGRAAIWEYDFDICFQNHIHRLRPLEKISSRFIYFYFCYLSQSGRINNYRKGMGISNLSSKSLASIPFPLPPLVEQAKISDFLNDFEHNLLKEDGFYFNEDIEKKVKNLHNSQMKGLELTAELRRQLTMAKELRQQFVQDAVQGKLLAQNIGEEPASELLKEIETEKNLLVEKKKIRKSKALPSIKPEEFPYDIPMNWVWCRLGDISLFSEAGKSYQALNMAAPKGQIGVIKTSAITSGFFLETENKCMPDQSVDIKKILIKQHDILFCRASGSKDLAGKSCWVKNVPYAGLILSDKSIRYNFSKHISKEYINVFNSSVFAKLYYQGLRTGKSTSMNNITREQFNLLPIPLPPREEQDRIVRHLDQLDKCCAQLEQNINISNRQNKKIMQQLMSEALMINGHVSESHEGIEIESATV